jgi:hypothetical protein
MRLLSTIALTLVAALLAAPAETCAQPFVKQVEVTNFPDPQSVAGSVEVTNLPVVQDVNVTNTPLTVVALPASRFELIGFTIATFTGDMGVLGFTLACQAEFGDESRMCTSAEVVETLRVPTASADFSWVRPVFQPKAVATGSTNESQKALDISGRQTDLNPLSNLSCRGWAGTTNLQGLAVDSQGRFTESSCDSPRSVACCALVE